MPPLPSLILSLDKTSYLLKVFCVLGNLVLYSDYHKIAGILDSVTFFWRTFKVLLKSGFSFHFSCHGKKLRFPFHALSLLGLLTRVSRCLPGICQYICWKWGLGIDWLSLWGSLPSIVLFFWISMTELCHNSFNTSTR